MENDEKCVCLCLQGEGQTALHIASAQGDETLVKYFYGVRANASIVDSQGK
jgi:ankyrin repeat protein